jgi:hypothetical protein
LKLPDLEITGIDEESAAEMLLQNPKLFTSSLKIDRSNDNSKLISQMAHDNAKKVVNLLDRIPIAIEQAGALLSKGISLTEFIELYDSHFNQIMETKPIRAAWHYEKNMCVSTIIGMLYQSLEQENQDAARLLLLLSFFGPSVIYLDMFTLPTKNARDEMYMFQNISGIAAKLELWLFQLAKNKISFRLSLSRLQELCLCKIQKNLEGTPVHISVHNTIRRWCQETRTDEEKEGLALVSARLLDETIRVKSGSFILQQHKYGSHTQNCWRNLLKLVGHHFFAPPEG